MCERFFEEGWVRHLEGSRAVALTGEGELAIRERLGLRILRAGGLDRPANDTGKGNILER